MLDMKKIEHYNDFKHNQINRNLIFQASPPTARLWGWGRTVWFQGMVGNGCAFRVWEGIDNMPLSCHLTTREGGIFLLLGFLNVGAEVFSLAPHRLLFPRSKIDWIGKSNCRAN